MRVYCRINFFVVYRSNLFLKITLEQRISRCRFYVADTLPIVGVKYARASKKNRTDRERRFLASSKIDNKLSAAVLKDGRTPSVCVADALRALYARGVRHVQR